MFSRSAGIFLAALFAVFTLATAAHSHCEIPCGIYDDSMRIDMLKEHVMTMEKSMNEIQKLDPANAQENNQLVRWIDNKDLHANKFQEIVSQYFLTQRIEQDETNYTRKVTLLHQMLVYAMKCKQTLDKANIEKLYALIDSFEDVYFEDGQ